MTDPTATTTSLPSFSPYRLTLDMGPTWLSPAPEAASLPGFHLGARLGESYRMSERWNWGLQGVFSYSNYYAEHGNVSRVGFGFDTGPELTVAPNLLAFGLYAGLQEAFYYSSGVSWPSRLGEASFNNEAVTSVSLRPAVLLFGGIFTTSLELSHDFGLTAPGPTQYDAPVGFSPNRYALNLSLDLLRAFYAARGGFTGASDNFEEFFTGIQPLALVEGSYNYSFNDPANVDGIAAANVYRPNTPYHHRPRFNMLRLGLQRDSTEDSPLGFSLVTYFGQDGGVFIPANSLQEPVIGERGEPDTQYFAIKRATLTYRFPILHGLTFEAGVFPTPVGIELSEASLNSFQLTTRGLLSNAQFTNHAGARFTLRTTETRGRENPEAEETVQDFTEVSVGVTNGADSVLGHQGGPMGVFTFNHQVNRAWSYALNYLMGAQNGEGVLGLFDANATWNTPATGLTLGANMDLGHGHSSGESPGGVWFGLGFFQQYTLASWENSFLREINVAGREEILVDREGYKTGISQNLVSATGALNVLFPYGFGLTPVELRVDHSFGREEGVDGPFLSGRDPTNTQAGYTARAWWKYPF